MGFKRFLSSFQKPQSQRSEEKAKEMDWSGYASQIEQLPLPKPEHRSMSYEAGVDHSVSTRSRGDFSSSMGFGDLNCVDFSEKTLTAAALIGVEVTHKLLGLEYPEIAIKFVSTAEMGRNDPGKWDPATATMYLNRESPYLQTPVDAAVTVIHETLHKYVSLEVGDIRLNEAATEYAAQKILEAICQGDQHREAEIAYESGFKFFDQLGQTLGATFVVTQILQGNFTSIADAYDQKTEDAGVPRFALETLIGLKGSNQSWDSNLVIGHLEETNQSLGERGLLPKDQKFDLSIVDPGGQLSTEAQARAIVDATTAMSQYAPGNVYYISPDLGVISYVRPSGLVPFSSTGDAAAVGTVPPIHVQFGTSWRGSASHVSFPNLTESYDASVRTTRAKSGVTHDEAGTIKWADITPQEQTPEGRLAFERKAIEAGLRVATVQDEAFKLIATFQQLFVHLREHDSLATDYYLSILVDSVSIAMRLENALAFPPSAQQIARRIYQEALGYQEEYLIQGSTWDLTEHVQKKLVERLATRRLGPDNFIMAKYPVTLDSGIANKPYAVARKDSISKAVGIQREAQEFTNLLFDLAQQLLRRLYIPEPTNAEMAAVCKFLVDGTKKFKLSLTPKNLKEFFLGAYTGIIEKQMDLGTGFKDGVGLVLSCDGLSPEELLQKARELLKVKHL